MSEWIELYDPETSVPGYVEGSGGTIASPSYVQKERTSDWVKVEPGQKFRVSVEADPGASNYLWVAIGWYDENKGFLGRPSGTSSNGVTSCLKEWTAPADAAYARASARTFEAGIFSFCVEYDGGGCFYE